MIAANMEELSNYLGYFDVIAKLQGRSSSSSDGGDDGGDSGSGGGGGGGGGDPVAAEAAYSACVEYTDGVIVKAGGGSLARTPLLARVELAARKEALTGTAEDPASLGTCVWLPLFIDPKNTSRVEVSWHSVWWLDNTTSPFA